MFTNFPILMLNKVITRLNMLCTVFRQTYPIYNPGTRDPAHDTELFVESNSVTNFGSNTPKLFDYHGFPNCFDIK